MPITLQKRIEEAVPTLLDMAEELVWDNISRECKFILSEIKDKPDGFFKEWIKIKEENDQKTPRSLEELMPIMHRLYNNLYDINLYIYKSTKEVTIIDIRYYPKSSLDEEYRKSIGSNEPMLHCKVVVPPWLTNKKEKFDINWQHRPFLKTWKMFWTRLKLKFNLVKLS